MVSAPGLGPGRQSSILCFPTRGSLAQQEERPVEAREVPVRFGGEPPCPTGLTAMTPVFQTGDRGSIPRWGSRAPRAIQVKHSTLNRGKRSSSLRRRTDGGVAQLADAAASSTARCGFESRLPYSMIFDKRQRCPFVQPAGQRALDALIVVRIHGGQRCRRARLRLRFRTADGPGRHRVAAHMCSYSNHGREASPRCWRLRVRLPPSARRRGTQPTGPDGRWGKLTPA